MSKKSETIEIRISHEMKQRLASIAATRGDTMSGMVRDAVSAHCLQPPGEATKGANLMQTLKISAIALMMGTVTLAAGALMLTRGVAVADLAEPGDFEAMDYNEDSIISRAEYAAAVEIEMLSYAAPVGSADEAPDWPQECAGDIVVLEGGDDVAAPDFAEIDQNKDDRISRPEFNAKRAELFRAEIAGLDSDKDGAISFDEFKAMAGLDPAENLAPFGEKISAPCLTALEADLKEIEAEFEAVAAELDADADDMAKEGEAQAADDSEMTEELAMIARELREEFDTADVNGDGKLSPEELMMF